MNFKQIKLLKGEGCRHTQVGKKVHQMIVEKKITSQSVLMYTYIGVSMNSYNDNKYSCSLQDFVDKFSYSKKSCIKYINSLLDCGLIELIKKGNGKTKSTYRFIGNKESKFERFTKIFVHSKDLSTKDKEFLILISPYILEKNSCITNNFSKIASWLNVNRATVARLFKSLIDKGFVKNDDVLSDMLFVDLYKAQLSGAIGISEELTKKTEESEALKARIKELERSKSRDYDELREAYLKLDSDFQKLKASYNELKKENDYLTQNS